MVLWSDDDALVKKMNLEYSRTASVLRHSSIPPSHLVQPLEWKFHLPDIYIYRFINMNMTISFARYKKITINMEESSIVSSDASISLVSPVLPGVTKLGC